MIDIAALIKLLASLVLFGPAILLSWAATQAKKVALGIVHPRRILVTVLDGESAKEVIRWLAEESGLMSMFTTEVHLLHVASGDEDRFVSDVPVARLGIDKEAVSVHPMRGHICTIRGLPQVTANLSQDQVAQRRDLIVRAVTEASNRLAAAYILTGSKQGHLGPVTEGLVRSARCPVAVVKHS